MNAQQFNEMNKRVRSWTSIQEKLAQIEDAIERFGTVPPSGVDGWDNLDFRSGGVMVKIDAARGDTFEHNLLKVVVGMLLDRRDQLTCELEAI